MILSGFRSITCRRANMERKYLEELAVGAVFIDRPKGCSNKDTMSYIIRDILAYDLTSIMYLDIQPFRALGKLRSIYPFTELDIGSEKIRHIKIDIANIFVIGHIYHPYFNEINDMCHIKSIKGSIPKYFNRVWAEANGIFHLTPESPLCFTEITKEEFIAAGLQINSDLHEEKEKEEILKKERQRIEAERKRKREKDEKIRQQKMAEKEKEREKRLEELRKQEEKKKRMDERDEKYKSRCRRKNAKYDISYNSSIKIGQQFDEIVNNFNLVSFADEIIENPSSARIFV